MVWYPWWDQIWLYDKACGSLVSTSACNWLGNEDDLIRWDWKVLEWSVGAHWGLGCHQPLPQNDDFDMGLEVRAGWTIPYSFRPSWVGIQESCLLFTGHAEQTAGPLPGNVGKYPIEQFPAWCVQVRPLCYGTFCWWTRRGTIAQCRGHAIWTSLSILSFWGRFRTCPAQGLWKGTAWTGWDARHDATCSQRWFLWWGPCNDQWGSCVRRLKRKQ